MSDEQKPPVGGKRGKRPLQVVKSGSVLAEPSEDQVKQIFMASRNLEWIPFAKSQNWDPIKTRSKFPVSEWITQKKEALAREQSEQIAELLFDHRSRWHKDVLKTMRDYPEAADAVLGIINQKQNQYIKMIQADREEEQKAAKEKREPNFKFDKVKTGELLALASALKIATETKHKSLLISDWSVAVAEQFTDPAQFEREEAKMKDTSWKFEIMGGESLTSAQMEGLLSKWYDKPNQIHTIDQIAPEPEKEVTAVLPPEEEDY